MLSFLRIHQKPSQVVGLLVLLVAYCVNSFAASRVFELGINETKYLPPPMYGTWEVKATLISTDSPNLFPSSILDIWTLEQTQSDVIISNPASGATAGVTIDSVQGSTATFHHMVKDGTRRIFYETPTVTVDENNDTLSGQTVSRIETYRKGRKLATYTANYRLKAIRIGGARLNFRPSSPPPSFEIAPIQYPR